MKWMIVMQLPTYYCVFRGYQGVAPEATTADSSVGSDLSPARIIR